MSSDSQPEAARLEKKFFGDFDEEPLTYDVDHAFGYAPIKLGDRVGPRKQFEVVRKLGWGFHGTIWMVRDHEQARYLALKVLTAFSTYRTLGKFKDMPKSNEAPILRRVAESTSESSPGAQYCIRFVDQFHLTYNGDDHLSLLTELTGVNTLIMQLLIAKDGFLPELTKLLVYQLCSALAYLHDECRVVHAGIDPTNILLSFSKDITEELIRLYDEVVPAETWPKRTIDGISVETVKSQPLPIPGFQDLHPAKYVIKVADFNVAQWLGQRRTHSAQSAEFRAPEVVVGYPWDEKIDIWSLGCMVCTNVPEM
ncbi:kinase-like domain-containing protein [Amylocystis lapponica]|nr:kinase-like domain-containing protein [Amylocystis lapponica]